MKDHIYEGEFSICGKSWCHACGDDDDHSHQVDWKKSKNRCGLCVRIVAKETGQAAKESR